MKQSVVARIALALLVLLAASEGVQCYEKVEVGVTHRTWSGIAATLHRAHHMYQKLHGKGVPEDLPRDAMGNVLLSYPDPETNEHGEIKADLTNEENQEKLDAYLDNLLSDHVELEEEAARPPKFGKRRYKSKERWFAGEMDRLSRREQKDAKKAIGEAGQEFSAIAKSAEDSSLDAVDVIIAIVFGFVNGAFMGLGDLFRDNIRRMRNDPSCKEPIQRLRTVLESMKNAPKLMKGLFGKRKDRGNMSRWKFLKTWGKRTLEDIGELIAGVWNLAMKCDSMKRIIRPLFKLLAIGAVFTLLMYAFPAFGWLIKFCGMIITFIFSLKFLWKTIKKFFAARKVCKANKGCTKQAKIDTIESVCEIIGWLYTLFMMASSQDWKKIKEEFGKFKNSKLGKKLGLKPDKQMQQDVSTLDKSLKAARRGDRTELQEFSNELDAQSGSNNGPPGQGTGNNGPPGQGTGNTNGGNTGGATGNTGGGAGPPSGGTGGTGGTSTGGAPPSNGYGNVNNGGGTTTGGATPPGNGYGGTSGLSQAANGNGWVPPIVVDKEKDKPIKKPTNPKTPPVETKPPNPYIPEIPSPPEITLEWMGIIHFEFDKDCIGCSNEPHYICAEELEDIKAQAYGTDTPLYIAGYTDTVGSNGYNDKLAKRRALAVARALRSANPPIMNALSVGWYGEKRSTDSGNKSAKDTAANRKVEVTNIQPKTFKESIVIAEGAALGAHASQIKCSHTLPVKK